MRSGLRKSLPRAGFTLVEVLVAIGVAAVLIGMLLPAVQRLRDAASRVQCSNNLRQISLALHAYDDVHKSFPPGVRLPPNPLSFVAWNARILPFLEQNALWRQALEDFARQPNAWVPKSPHPGLSTSLAVFICPADGRAKGRVEPEGFDAAFTHYLGVAGHTSFTQDGVLYADSRTQFRSITDGASCTLLVGERPPSPDNRFGWWYAGVGQEMTGSADMFLGVEDRRITFLTPTCKPGPYRFGPGKASDICDTFHFWSQHVSGANFAFADGSVRFLTYGAAPIMPALATRAGGEPATIPD